MFESFFPHHSWEVSHRSSASSCLHASIDSFSHEDLSLVWIWILYSVRSRANFIFSTGVYLLKVHLCLRDLKSETEIH